MNQRQFERRPSKPTANPRKVVGGVKLSPRKAGSGNAGVGGAETPWVIHRWLRLVETYAPGDQLAEGLEYARLGQTRSLELGAGTITARVQGRMPKAYSVSIRLPTFTEAQWPSVIDAMIAQARYAAALLSGEVPANIEDLFIPAGLKLFPSEPSDVAVSCECSIFTGKPETAEESPAEGTGGAAGSGERGVGSVSRGAPEKSGTEPNLIRARSTNRPVPMRATTPLPPGVPWCKHACCVMALVADRLASDPFMIFALRGLPPDDLIDRLRQRRQASGGAGSVGGKGGASAHGTLVYESHLPGVSDRVSKPLEECVDGFWTAPGGESPREGAESGEAGAGIESLDLTIAAPEVSHPLLRRMGASPFPRAKFPIVGLLATCYDLVSRDAISRTRAEEPGVSEDEPA